MAKLKSDPLWGLDNARLYAEAAAISLITSSTYTLKDQGCGVYIEGLHGRFLQLQEDITALIDALRKEGLDG